MTDTSLPCNALNCECDEYVKGGTIAGWQSCASCTHTEKSHFVKVKRKKAKGK